MVVIAIMCSTMINRPGVAGAVLQTSFIHSFIAMHLVILVLNIFKMPSLENRKIQRVESLRECSPRTTCCMSPVMCHISHVTCQHIFFIFYKVVKPVGGGSVINGVYTVYLFNVRSLEIDLSLSSLGVKQQHIIDRASSALQWIDLHCSVVQ